MDDDFLLLNPGPVPVSDEVREAMSAPMMSHRSAEFETIYERAQAGAEYVFTHSTANETDTSVPGETLIFNGTATMAMEAAVANVVEQGDEVVSLVNGKFGRRFARIADRYTDAVTRVEAPWGESISLSDVDAAVSDETVMVTMVHNETSTGLQNPAWGVGRIARESDALFVLDGVTSIGGDVFSLVDWHVDIALTDAQKALAAPPGTSAMYLTERAASRIDGESAPFYEDLDWHLRKADSHQTPFTSAIPLYLGLAEAVEEIQSEGMPTRIDRHHRQARAFRDGFTEMGLELFATASDHTVLSNTLTAVSLPEGIRGQDEEFMAAVAERNVSISGGQAHLGGEIFRVSNMGRFADEDIIRGVETVGKAMTDVGVDVDTDAGVAAAKRRLE